jgi:catechol 2,3-dioxygenase-like lactoylglutathione lyase family enzyme
MPTTIPILSAPDAESASTFYRRLGFVETGRWGDYLILIHPLEIELHFNIQQRHDSGASAGGERGPEHAGAGYIRFETAEGAQLLHDAWARLEPQGDLSDLRRTAYGLLEFGLVDPFGNVLSIGGAVQPDP